MSRLTFGIVSAAVTAALLLALTWAISALDARDLSRGEPPHLPVLILAQRTGTPPFAVSPEELPGLGESVVYLPEPPSGWIEPAPGERVSWARRDGGGATRVRVTWSGGGRRVTTVYEVRGGSLAPLRSEQLGAGHLLAALIPTILLTGLFRVGVRRYVR
jgi:hypothetical protein